MVSIENENKACFYGIGVGPGDGNWITIEAKTLIEKMELLILPAKNRDSCRAYQIARASITNIDEKECIFAPFPMSLKESELSEFHNRLAKEVMQKLDEGKQIGFLTIGDPCIYSTYDYIERIVGQAGYRTGYISGIPSFCAAAAKLGIPLVVGDEQMHVIPGNADIKEALQLEGTIIFMKAGKHMAELKALLTEWENEKHLDVRAVSNCGMEDECIFLGAKNLPEDRKYFTVVICRTTEKNYRQN